MSDNKLIAENNRSIAEFMGGIELIGHDDKRREDAIFLDGQIWFLSKLKPDDMFYLNYNSNWNSLMPVVEKIEAFGYAIIDIHREATIIKVYDGEECIWKTNQWNQESKIDHVYQAIVKFIIWYNKSLQSPQP